MLLFTRCLAWTFGLNSSIPSFRKCSPQRLSFVWLLEFSHYTHQLQTSIFVDPGHIIENHSE